MSKPNSKPVTPPQFAVGDRVRVKPGVVDPEYPDMPMGGWLGTVSQVEEAAYLVQWSEATLAAVHPIYHKRCQQDGVDFQHMWLQAEELELDPGEPLCIQQPANIIPRPLRP